MQDICFKPYHQKCPHQTRCLSAAASVPSQERLAIAVDLREHCFHTVCVVVVVVLLWASKGWAWIKNISQFFGEYTDCNSSISSLNVFQIHIRLKKVFFAYFTGICGRDFLLNLQQIFRIAFQHWDRHSSMKSL